MNVRYTNCSKKIRKSFVRCLRSEFSQLKTIKKDLEDLKLLDQKLIKIIYIQVFRYLVKIRNFFIIDIGPKANSLILIEYEAFSTNLFDKLNTFKEPECVRRLVIWAYQVFFVCFLKLFRLEKF